MFDWQVMQFIWPAVKALIVSTWENIKGVIQGALNIILGLIKFFSVFYWRLARSLGCDCYDS